MRKCIARQFYNNLVIQIQNKEVSDYGNRKKGCKNEKLIGCSFRFPTSSAPLQYGLMSLPLRGTQTLIFVFYNFFLIILPMPVHCRKFGKQESIKSKIKVVLQARGNHYQICNHYRILYLLSSSVCVHMFYFTSNWQTLLLITLDLTLIGQLIRRGMLLVSQPSVFLSVSSP